MAGEKKNYVRVSNDNMTAYMYLVDPGENVRYSRMELEAFLQNNKVTMGIDREALKYIIENSVYYREVVVAKGQPPVNGQDGYFEYHFNRVINKKPDAKADGTIDYWNISSIENVTKNQVLAVYHEAVQGSSGFTVRGKSLMPKRARELMPLKGKGFAKLDDGITYVSLMDGKIEFSNDRIYISEIYEITGDVDLSIGNINFAGDVVVYGKVCAGVTIKVGGNFEVNGNVEAAEIEVGKNAIFRSGMQGGYKANIKVGGDLTAKFIENMTVDVGGTINADVIMNTDIISCERLVLQGKKAIILGGKVHAIQGIDVKQIGNEVETITEVSVGIHPDILVRKKILEKKIEKNQTHIQKIDDGIKKFEELMRRDQRIKRDDPRKAQLIRAKIQDSVVLSQDRAELAKIKNVIEKGKNAYIRVGGYIYPRVEVVVHGNTLRTYTKEMAVEYTFSVASGEIVKKDLFGSFA